MLLHCQGALFNFLGIATLKDFTNPQTLNNLLMLKPLLKLSYRVLML